VNILLDFPTIFYHFTPGKYLTENPTSLPPLITSCLHKSGQIGSRALKVLIYLIIAVGLGFFITFNTTPNSEYIYDLA
jgi:hypothetical protein